MYFDGKEILIIGGTGSLGSTLLRILKRDHKPKGIRIFSRDEFKQWQLFITLVKEGYDLHGVSRLLGDVRDLERLRRAFSGVDIVIHCAAQKHVPSCEENPLEAIKTNILGTANVVEAALDTNVADVFFISTDKAVYPINLYGASKAVAEKLIIDANVYRGGKHRTRFSAVRYGNVLGSRGSILPLFKDLHSRDETIPITDKDMTRFFIKLPEVAQFILDRIPEAEGGQIFIPKMKGIRIVDLAYIVAPGSMQKIVGIRPGEKLHEVLISEEEARWRLAEYPDHYIIRNVDGEEDKTAKALTSEMAAAENKLTQGDIENGLYL